MPYTYLHTAIWQSVVSVSCSVHLVNSKKKKKRTNNGLAINPESNQFTWWNEWMDEYVFLWFCMYCGWKKYETLKLYSCHNCLIFWLLKFESFSKNRRESVAFTRPYDCQGTDINSQVPKLQCLKVPVFLKIWTFIIFIFKLASSANFKWKLFGCGQQSC